MSAELHSSGTPASRLLTCDECGGQFPRRKGPVPSLCPDCRRDLKNRLAREERDQAAEGRRPELGELEWRPPVGPEEHAIAQKALGLRSKDELLALSSQNDPFYIGTPADLRDAEWFMDLWRRSGVQRAHVRRIHYWAISTPGVRDAHGRPYQNTGTCITHLGKAAVYARVLGLLDPELVDDRKNNPAIINCPPRDWSPTPEVSLGTEWRDRLRLPGMDDVALEFPAAWAYGYNYQAADQPALIEVWIEKSTMNDVLVPLCQRLGINLVPAGGGMQSISSVIKLLRRAQSHGKPAHVIYIADFDPAGDCMARSVARQCQFWSEQLGAGEEITVEQVALTADQVREYGLPPVPIKDSDRRRANFEARYGVSGAVELDALEALHPGDLARMVREAVAPWMDDTLQRRLYQAGGQADDTVSGQWEDATADLRGELARIEAVAQGIVGRYQQELEPLQDRLDQLARQARERLDGMDFGLPERPEPDDPDPDRDGFLYDSGRDWLEQLDYWQRHRNGDRP